MNKSMVLLAVALFFVPSFAAGGSDDATAYKAEFIINLIDNVEWPDDSKPSDSEGIIIHVVGESPVLSKLEELAEKAGQKGKKIEIKTVSITEDLDGSHILFLCTDDLAVLAQVLKKLNGTRTVTVADAKDFARYGVMISFFEDEKDSKVHYEVNRLVVESAGLDLSSKIMDKAELI